MVYLRLYSSLTKYLKSAGAGDPVPFEIEDGSSVRDLIGRLGIGEEEVFLVSVNGKLEDKDFIPSNGAEVSLFGPIAGGSAACYLEMQMETDNTGNAILKFVTD